MLLPWAVPMLKHLTLLPGAVPPLTLRVTNAAAGLQFENAAERVLQALLAADEEGRHAAVEPVQIMLYTTAPLVQSRSMSIRDLDANRVMKLVAVTGIITASSKPKVHLQPQHTCGIVAS